MNISQEAREAAAKFVEWLIDAELAWSQERVPFFQTGFPAAIREGIWDEHEIVQAIAAAEARGMERAAQIADAYGRTSVANGWVLWGSGIAATIRAEISKARPSSP